MYIGFINKKIRKVCENHALATKKLGIRNANRLFQRIGELRAAENLRDFLKLRPRSHPLKHNRGGQYAVDLIHPKRLILLPTTDQGEIVEQLVKEVTVIEIVDYH